MNTTQTPKTDRSTLIQLALFGLVGGAATATHGAVYMALIRILETDENLANFLAFLIAFVVSYLGHALLTFRAGTGGGSLIRFFVVALIGLGVNALAVFGLVTVTQFPDWSALPIMLFVTPALTFLISKYWAFRA